MIDPAKIDAFERFGRRWMELVDSHGGMHHGYFLPAEGASDKALALFSFPSLAAYEQYRACSAQIPTSSKQTASGTRAAACSATNAPSCARCYPGSKRSKRPA
ncbi:MAG TPA: NIPSNAP family protein [Streptosporangiaceae bacterium]